MFKRKTSNNYYYQLRDPKTGIYGVAHTTSTSSLKEAKTFAKQKYLETTTNQPDRFGPNTEVMTLIRNFWNRDSDYFKERMVLNPKKYQSQYIEMMAKYAELYIAPIIGKQKIKDVNPVSVSRMRKQLLEVNPQLSGSTLNHVFASYTRVFRWAASQWIIQRDPTERIPQFPKNTARAGIFEEYEIQKLMNIPWDIPGVKNLFKLCLMCGLRRGEGLALRMEDLQSKDHHDGPVYFINLVHSWSVSHGLKCPKNGKSRGVPIPEGLWQELKDQGCSNPNADGFIFWSEKEGKPLSEKIVYRVFKKALIAVGISEVEIEKRNLRFHSTRHQFNTSMINLNKDSELVRRYMGHMTPEMTDHYYHHDVDGLKEIGKSQENLIKIWNSPNEGAVS